MKIVIAVLTVLTVIVTLTVIAIHKRPSKLGSSNSKFCTKAIVTNEQNRNCYDHDIVCGNKIQCITDEPSTVCGSDKMEVTLNGETHCVDQCTDWYGECKVPFFGCPASIHGHYDENGVFNCPFTNQKAYGCPSKELRILQGQLQCVLLAEEN